MGNCGIAGDWSFQHGLIPSNVINLVSNYFNQLYLIADSQLQNLHVYSDALSSIANSMPEIRGANPTPTNLKIEFGDLPDSPIMGNISDLMSRINELIELVTSVRYPSLPPSPDINFSAELNLPQEPSEVAINFPVQPTISDINIPSPPEIVLSGDFPTIPDAPTLTFPEDIDLLDIEAPQPFEIDFSYIHNLFTKLDIYKEQFESLKSNMLSTFNEDLITLQNNLPTKIDASEVLNSLKIFYEGAYLNKYDSDLTAQFEYAKNKAITDLLNKSQNGFSLPPAFVLANIRDIEASFRDKRMELQYDYNKTKLGLYADGLKFQYQFYVQLMTLVKDVDFKVFGAIQDIWKIHSDIFTKLFEMQKYITELELSIIKELANYFKLIMEYYLTKYKYIELKLETNKQFLEIYKTIISKEMSKLDAYGKLIDALKTRVAIISERNQAEKLKVDIYTAFLQGIGLQAQIQRDKVALYEALMRGETAKIELYRAKLQGYQSVISARVAELEGKLKASLGKADLYKTQVSAIATLYDALKSQINGYAQAMDGISRPISGLTQIYSSMLQAEIAKANLEAQTSADVARVNIAGMELAMREYEAIVRLAIERSRNSMDGLKSLATVIGHVCSSALSGIHVASQLTATSHDSLSETYYKAKTDSCSEQYIQSV